MARQKTAIYRPDIVQDQRFVERSHEQVKRSLELLERHEVPNTFIGHQKQQPLMETNPLNVKLSVD